MTMNKIEKMKMRIHKDGFLCTVKSTISKKINIKLDNYIQALCNRIYKNTPLKDAIIIESHNDFDCNGGAFYNYLIDHKFNNKYTVIWLLKNENRQILPRNVYAYRLYKPSWNKSKYMAISKYLLFDNVPIIKRRDTQISLYLTHGAFGLKDVRGVCDMGETADYLISPSPQIDNIMAYQWLMDYPSKKLVHLGYPSEDIFYQNIPDEFDKLVKKRYKKILLWMPTFRQLKNNSKRVDFVGRSPYGIPLVNSMEEYLLLDKKLKKNNILLVIKLHPMQDLDVICELKETDNIKWLDANTVKKLGMDTYRLLRFSDALLSDYSSVAYSYLHRDRPIGYILSDLEDYKRGVCVNNPDDYIAGDKIFNITDLFCFIEKLSKNRDDYVNERRMLFNKVYKYHDGNSCERIVQFLGL